MKSKIAFVCQECGYESPKFMGKCPECGEWNTLREFKVQNTAFKNDSPLTKFSDKEISAKKLSDIVYEDKKRLSTGFSEMDAVFGGGIVRGSATLLAGDPGIGKSTLLLQVELNILATKVSPRKVLYISGEESEE